VADKSELQHMPRAVDTLILSESRSSLIARGSNDAKAIMARSPEPVLRAKVKMNGKWGIIDKNGRFVVEPFYCAVRSFHCGMAAFSDVPVQRSQRLYQLAIDDLDGRVDKPLPIHRWASADGAGWGYYEPGHWGFVDEAWRVVIPATFKRVKDFSEDLAGVVRDGKWGFVSKDGHFAIEPRFDAVEDFSDGLSIVTLHGEDGCIDTSGEFVVKPNTVHLTGFVAFCMR
jgi:hypothetical protein